MPYLGKTPVNGFHTKQVISGDGSETTFTLNFTVASESSLIVSDNAVILEPTTGYDLTSGGTKIVFASAPASGERTYIHFLGQAILTQLLDSNGVELILDVDGDTSFTADTDDEIDIKVGGSDRSTIKTTGFHNLDNISFSAGAGDDLQIYHDATNSFIANKTGTLKIATETSGVPITIGHTTSELTIADNATVAGNLTVTGTLTQTGTQTFDGGIDVDNFNINGTTIALSSGDMVLDSAGDIILDTDGADIVFKDGGTQFGKITNASTHVTIFDGTTLNTTMAGANITFAGTVGSGAITSTGTITGTGFIIGSASVTEAQLEILDGATVTTTELNLLDGGTSASSVTIADADRIILNDNGTMKQVAVSALNTYTSSSVAASSISAGSEAVLLATSAGNITIDAAGNDTDIILKGTDGNADTTFLTIDGSAAGEATFNAGIVIADAGNIGSASDKDAIAIASDGVVTFSQNPVGTLATAAQANITSVGTLTALTVDDVAIDGKVITMTGSSSDTAVFTAAANGALSIVTTDAGGAAGNIQITADGTAELAGTTVTLDSAGGITLDADGGTITFADAGSSLGTITSSGYSGVAAVATAVTVTDNEDTNENNVLTFVAGADSDGGNVGLESDGNLTYNPSTGTLSATNLVVSGTQTITNSVTMNASNAVVFEGATADAHETTLTTIDATGDRTISLPNVAGTLPVLAAVSATAITSTPEELNILDGATVVVGEINALDIGSTAVGTAVASKAVILDSNKDYTGIRNLTITGELDAATLDISGAVDIDGALDVAGTTNLDVVDIDGAVDMASTLQVDGVATFSAVPVFPNNTIETADLQADCVTAAKIGDNVLNSEHYAAGSIDAEHLASDSVTEAKMAANSVDSDSYVDASIDHVHLAADCIDGDNIQDDVLNSEHYAAGSIDAEHLASDSVTEAKMAANSVDSQAYVDGSIDTAHIANLNVTGGKLALDRRSASAGNDVYSGNDDTYTFYDANVGIRWYTANAEDMRLTDAGALHVDDDIIAFSSTISDERLKHDIEPITDALSKVGQLNGCTFTYNKDDKKGAGLIAQDVEKVLPSAVSEKELPLHHDDGVAYKTVEYDQTIGLLVEAIKELTAKVEKLEKK